MQNWIDKYLKTANPEKSGMKKSHVPFRLNFLFFVIFTLFVLLIGRLSYLQIMNNEMFEQRLKVYTGLEVNESTPRGMIYDASGKPLVKNIPNAAITFTRGSKMGSEDLLEVAQKLPSLIQIEKDAQLTERDLKDYWLANPEHLKATQKRLTRDEASMLPPQQYQAMLAYVTEADIDFDEQQLKEATVFKRLNSAQALNTVYVKNRKVTNEDLAIVAEHATELPGISTGTDWTREVTEKSSLATLVGKVSTEAQGLPAEEAADYLAKGYVHNDRVGTSFLEKQYEETLQGKKAKSEIVLDNDGNVESKKEVSAGEKGDNIKLSINSEFQKQVDDILRANYQYLVDIGVAEYSPGAYVAAMNPKTGEVIALSGYYHEIKSKKIEEDAIGTFNKAFVPGSVVKGATVSAGWENGIIKGNQTLLDEPLFFEGTAPKASIFNKFGWNNRQLTAEQALELSSNTYMMKIALGLLNTDYKPDMRMPSVKYQKDAYDKLRHTYGEYGMGVLTGIDMPNEAQGLKPAVDTLSDENHDGGKILDLSFGQFDTYTPIQLAQYASTVANGGQRVQPRLVSGIYGNDAHGNLGKEKQTIQPNVLNRVDISNDNMKIIQKGFYNAVYGNDPFTSGRQLSGAKMSVSAKTGTAETVVYDNGNAIDVDNLNVVVYGPSDDAEIALAVVLPQLKETDYPPNLLIAREIMDAYYDFFIAGANE